MYNRHVCLLSFPTLFAILGLNLFSDLVFALAPLILLLNWQSSLIFCVLCHHRIVRFLFLAFQAR